MKAKITLTVWTEDGNSKDIVIPSSVSDAQWLQGKFDLKRKVMGDAGYCKWMERFIFDLVTKGKAS